MFITPLGSIGIGLVWGWLIGELLGHGQKSFSNIVWVGLATSLAAIEILWLARRGFFGFLVATGMSLVINMCWRRHLRTRIESV